MPFFASSIARAAIVMQPTASQSRVEISRRALETRSSETGVWNNAPQLTPNFLSARPSTALAAV
jgi:hypothetical protein